MLDYGVDFKKPFVNHKEERKRDYVDYMTFRLFTMFEYKGLPSTIPDIILERVLQWNGNACIFKYDGELYATFGGLGGEPDYNYEPTVYVIANPYLNYSAELRIGEDCVRFRNDAFGKGLLPLHVRYADILVENDITLRIMDIIRRIDHGITADNDTGYESAKQFLAGLEEGKLAPMMDENFFNGIKAFENSNQSVTDLIELQQYLRASWFNELGLNSNYNMKRERIAAPEAQMNDSALLPLADHLLDMRKRGCEMVNEMFGTEWSVDFSGAWKSEQEKQFMFVGKDDETDGTEEETSNDGGSAGESDGNDTNDPTISDSNDSIDDDGGDASEGDDPMEDRLNLNVNIINTFGDDNIVDVLEEPEDNNTENTENGGVEYEEETD